MSTTEKMTIDERYKYLRIVQGRYMTADRKAQQMLLDEMEKTTGMHRKSLIGVLSGEIVRHGRRKQRGRVYGAEVADAIRVIGESLDWVCAERLRPSLVGMAKHLETHGELRRTPELLVKLERISISSVARILAQVGQDEPRLPRKGPESANQVARQIPMRRIAWNEAVPGHIEVDLVHHCGPNAQGDFIHTLQLIDVATGWSERVAILGRSYLVMADAFRFIQHRIPFPILELHPDNGTEFLNQHLVRFWNDLIPNLDLSRSRPYQKNDNRFVEQKNDTLVRKYFGQERFDSVAQVRAMNEIYDDCWLFYNFFQPVMRLKDKIIVNEDGQPARVKRIFDHARSPLERLFDTAVLSDETRAELLEIHLETNPRALRRDIHAALQLLFDLPGAKPDDDDYVFFSQHCFCLSPCVRLFRTTIFQKGADSLR